MTFEVLENILGLPEGVSIKSVTSQNDKDMLKIMLTSSKPTSITPETNECQAIKLVNDEYSFMIINKLNGKS